MPLALVTGRVLYFIHPDHLGTPQKATDSAQNLAWDIVPRPFGQTEQQTFPPLSNLRMPGQYLDAETGMHANYFRDYDPTTGRYIESDPLGIDATIYGITIGRVATAAANQSLYTYVENNPTNLWAIHVTARTATAVACDRGAFELYRGQNRRTVGGHFYERAS
jgi:RHS repeat-associated protein